MMLEEKIINLIKELGEKYKGNSKKVGEEIVKYLEDKTEIPSYESIRKYLKQFGLFKPQPKGKGVPKGYVRRYSAASVPKKVGKKIQYRNDYSLFPY